MKTTLDLAMIRWAVICCSWSESTAVGNFPNLGAFLAGWFSRDLGIPMEIGNGIVFINSWCKGWDECECQIGIMDQSANLKHNDP